MSVLWRISKTILLVLNYYAFSITLTFYNKKVMSDYPFPLCITMFHLFLKFLLASVVRAITRRITGKPHHSIKWKDYMKMIVPVAIFSSLDIGLSNWSLVYITVSLYTMSKSTALVFILLFAVIFRLERPRLPQILIVLLIFVGLFLFTYESTSFEWEGFILVLMASVVTGLRWSTAQLTIQKHDLHLSNPVDIIYNLQPIMILTLLPLASFIDAVNMGTSRHIFLAPSATVIFKTLLTLIAAGLLAFMLGISEYLLVYHTSGLTLSISGVFKEIIILTVSTTVVEKTQLDGLRLSGMALCVAGITVHSVLKAISARDDEKKKLLDNTATQDETELIDTNLHNSSSSSHDSDDEIETKNL